MKVAVFPGHIGKDAGAINGFTDDKIHTIEAVITGEICSRIVTLFSLIGIDYIFAKGRFSDRIELTKDCTLGISIHVDYFVNPEVHGYHLIYYPGSMGGEKLSDLINEMLYKYTHNMKREPHTRHDLEILKKTTFPCVLIETGFISNNHDEVLLNSEEYQWKIALGVCAAIMLYH